MSDMLPRDAEQRAFIIAVCEWGACEVVKSGGATDVVAGISLYYAISEDTVDIWYTRALLMPHRRLVECAHFPDRSGSALQVRMAGLYRSLDHVRPSHLRHAHLRRQGRQVCLRRLQTEYTQVLVQHLC
jgi:hypothetical protein